MYLTSHRIQYGDDSEPLLSFLYEHDRNYPPTPHEVEEILGKNSIEGLTLVDQSNEDLEMGGNLIISYLDIVGPNNMLVMPDSFPDDILSGMRKHLAGAPLPCRYYLPLNEMEMLWFRFGIGQGKYRLDRNIIDEFEELVADARALFESYVHEGAL